MSSLPDEKAARTRELYDRISLGIVRSLEKRTGVTDVKLLDRYGELCFVGQFVIVSTLSQDTLLEESDVLSRQRKLVNTFFNLNSIIIHLLFYIMGV